MITTGHTTVFVDVLNHDETETGQTVPVQICYMDEIDSSYGADADGNRGVKRVERVILDHYIDPEFIKTLDNWQVERVLQDANEAVYRKDS